MLDFDSDGFVDFYDWGRILDLSSDMTSMFKVLNIRTGKLEPLIVNLTEKEQQECSNMFERIIRVADHANDRGIRIMIDAEQVWFFKFKSLIIYVVFRLTFNRQFLG